MIVILDIIIIVIIAFIIWWFWLYKPKATKIVESGEVIVTIEKGIYKPDRIAAYAGMPLSIRFVLNDDAHCAKKVIFADFDRSVELTKSEPQVIELTPDRIGEFAFACPMNMYRGVLEVKAAPAITITVDNAVYQPNRIEASAGKTINLSFVRRDPSRCAQMVYFPDFEIAEELPLNQPKSISIVPQQAGEYKFNCEMGMYSGTLIVNPASR